MFRESSLPPRPAFAGVPRHAKSSTSSRASSTARSSSCARCPMRSPSMRRRASAASHRVDARVQPSRRWPGVRPQHDSSRTTPGGAVKPPRLTGHVVDGSVIWETDAIGPGIPYVGTAAIAKLSARCAKSCKQRARLELGGRYVSGAWPSGGLQPRRSRYGLGLATRCRPAREGLFSRQGRPSRVLLWAERSGNASSVQAAGVVSSVSCGDFSQ